MLTMLAVLDAVTKAFEGVTVVETRKETLYNLLKYALYYLRMVSTRKININIESLLFQAIFKRWSIIIGCISDYE